MYTQCPHCHTAFRIYPDQLSQARGQVRCGVCNHCFNALEALTEHLAAVHTAPATAETVPTPTIPETVAPSDNEALGNLEEPSSPPPLPEIETAEAEARPEAEEAPISPAPEVENIPAEITPEFEELEETVSVPPELEHAEEPELIPEPSLPPAAAVTIKEAIAPPPAPTAAGIEETAVEEVEPIVTETTEAPYLEAPRWEGMTETDATVITLEGKEPESRVAEAVQATETEPTGEHVKDTQAEQGLPAEETPAVTTTPEEKGLPDLGIIAAEPRTTTETEALAEPEEKAAQGFKTILWTLVNVVLIVVLLGQYAYYNRSELSQYPQLRPWLAQMCSALGCDIPLQRDVQRIVLTRRLVESDPKHANALLIDATLVNEADFPQAYPVLEIRFSDLNNQLVAGRRFKPDEYLPAGTAVQAGMAPHQPAHIVLEIVDPGKAAVSFKFDLL